MTDPVTNQRQDPWKLCIPKLTRQIVLRENQNESTARYLGIAKISARIAVHYYWSGLFRDIDQYVRRCKFCQEYKLNPQKTPGKVQPSDNVLLWHTVSTNLVGPLPRSSRGNTYLAVFQDRFTKWVQCRAIRKPSARVVTKALYEEVITRFGYPNTVITDNRTQYTGRIFRNFHRVSPPYTP